MPGVMDEAAAWASRGQRVALAMVVGSRRSAPRPAGTKMAISDSGEIAGAVSGGCVEGAVVATAEELMRSGQSRLLQYGFSDDDAWDVGLQCGGEIDVWLEPYDPTNELVSAFEELRRDGGRGALVTLVRGGVPGSKLLVLPDGSRQGSLGTGALDDAAAGLADTLMWEERSLLEESDQAAFFVDVAAPPPRLFVFGAVDYAAAVCTVAKVAGWRPFVVDPRGRFAQPSRFPDAEQVLSAWPQEAFERLGGIDRATAIVVLTHDPKLDDAALHAALASDALYIGAMGSRNAQAARRERLLGGGVEEADLARILAPVGLDLGAVTAAETALSIVSEIVAARRGRRGGRLTDGSGRIHEDPGVVAIRGQSE